jgi:hypothetical protein
MQEAEQEGRTLVFVSHDLETLTRLCPQSLWLEAGRIRDAGPTPRIVREYLVSGLSARDDGSALLRSEPVTVHAIRVLPDVVQGSDALLRGDRLRIEVDFDVTEQTPGLDLALVLTTSAGVRVLDELLSDTAAMRLPVGRYRAELVVPPLLNVGDYTVGVWFGTQHEEFINEPVVTPFTVQGSDQQRSERIVILSVPIVVHPLEAPS